MIVANVTAYMYNVHMKHVTPSEARQNWFRLLDEAAGGETIVIERRGHRLVLREESEEATGPEPPSYARLLSVPDVDRADRWTWTWTGEGEDLLPADTAAPDEADAGEDLP